MLTCSKKRKKWWKLVSTLVCEGYAVVKMMWYAIGRPLCCRLSDRSWSVLYREYLKYKKGELGITKILIITSCFSWNCAPLNTMLVMWVVWTCKKLQNINTSAIHSNWWIFQVVFPSRRNWIYTLYNWDWQAFRRDVSFYMVIRNSSGKTSGDTQHDHWRTTFM